MTTSKVCFVLETGTDVRLVEGLSKIFNLTLVGRKIENGVTISQPTDAQMKMVWGPPSRIKFAQFVFNYFREQKEDFDYVIVQNYSIVALAANLASRLTKIPTSMLVCSPIEDYYSCRKQYTTTDKPFHYYELWGLMAIAWLNTIVGQHYIVLSEYLADVVRSHGIKKPISIIPIYGVDTKIFVPSKESKTELKARIGLPTSGSLIFFSSRIAPEKDSETLLLAFKSLLEQGRDLWLLHRSGGYQTFINEAKKYEIAERIIAEDALHPHKELPLNYQACDLCVQSSREEGLGFSPLEALACGIPVIASAVGGLQETIIDGHTGWTYSVGNSEKLAKCIEAVMDNPDEVSKRVANGQRVVLNQYETQIVFDKLKQRLNKKLNSI